MPYRKKVVNRVRPKRRYNQKRRPRGRYAPLIKKRVYKKRGQKQWNDKGVAEFTTAKAVGGARRKNNVKGAWKLLRAVTRKNIYGIEFANRFLNQSSTVNGKVQPPGTICAGALWTGASPGSGSVTLPLQLYELSAAPNYSQDTLTACKPAWFLQRNSASGTMFFANASNTLIPVETSKSGTGNTDCYPGSSDLLDAVSIKMLLYGALTRPIRYRIDIVQIMEPYYHPDYITNESTANTGALSSFEQNAVVGFYDQLVKEFTYNPVSWSNGNATKGHIKYLKSWTHTFQPKNTTEIATAIDQGANNAAETVVTMPHCRSFNIYERFNRRQNYGWEETETVPEVVGQYDSIPTSLGLNRTNVTYRARIYLMVRASAQVPDYNGTWDVEITPSYDISMRMYHTQVG